jgi:O-antigen/teichoic acid export membrane protein
MSKHHVIAWLRIAEAVANLTLSVILVQKIGLVGVALGTAIPSFIVVALVLPPVACRIVGVGLVEYYVKAYLRPALAVAPVVLFAAWLRNAVPAENLLVFFAQIAALLLVYVPAAFAIVLDAGERAYVLHRVRPARAAT